MTEFLERANDNSLTLKGDWVLHNVAAIQKELGAEKHDGALNAQIGKLDTAGATLLRELGGTVTGLQARQQALFDLVKNGAQNFPDAPDKGELKRRIFVQIGKSSVAGWHSALDLLRFIGETVIMLGRVIRNPAKLRGISVIRHINETGVAAIPIVALIAFLISIVLAYQGAGQLKRFGAEIFTINMVAISVLREMGVLLTAIMIAGRSGSAFTAEIGVMKVNEEVDAMRIIGITPFELLVLPRLIALLITLPLLTFVADLMGLLGGGIISTLLLDVGSGQYLDRVRDAAKLHDFLAGLIKAPVFAFFIAVIGCMRGMQVSGSAESVGRLTTVSVVQSIFIVLLLDALFAVFFTKVGF